MGAAQSVLEQYTPLITARLQRHDDPAWLRQWRETAHQRLRHSGLPGKHRESWHYSAADLWLQQFGERYSLAPSAPSSETAIAANLPAGQTLGFVNGYLTTGAPVLDSESVSLRPLAQLSEQESAELLAMAGQIDPLADLITTLAPETWVLTVAANAQVDTPIVLSQLATRQGCHIGQILVWLQTGASATLVEDFSATETAGDYLQLSHSLLKLEQNSRLTYARFNRDSGNAQHLGVITAQVGRDAQLRLQALESGCGATLSNRVRNGFHVRLAGNGAEFIARGAFAADDRQHIDYHFTVDHCSDHGRSDIQIQGLAAAKSQGIVNGRIYIAENTRGNDGQFTSHNLLLSADAEIDAKPELEIYADEVKCAHGATIGQLDTDQLLYLQTRGIDRDEAIALLTEGFLKAGLLDSGNSDLNDYFQRHLLAGLKKSGGILA